MNVALFGQFCAGKTSLAAELTDEYGYVVMSMAGNLKFIVGQVYGSLDKSAMVIANEKAISIRQVLQGIGDSVKTIDRDFWVRWFLKDAEDYEHIGIPVVCDDGRLIHEANRLRERGWLIVLVDTPTDIRIERFYSLYGRYPTPPEMTHRTEEEVREIEYDLIVDGTLPLERQAEIVISEVARRGSVPELSEEV